MAEGGGVESARALADAVESLDLISSCPEDVDDVAAFVRYRLSRATVRNDAIAGLLSGLARGNFLYAEYIAQHMIADPRRLERFVANPSSVPLPNDLAALYREFLNRELLRTTTPTSSNAWSQTFRPLLTRLAVASDPGLSIDQLRVVLPGNPSRGALRDALERTAHLLSVPTTADGPWRIFHHSFREYLVTGAERIIDPGDAHAELADALVTQWEGNWGEADDYGIDNVVLHHNVALADPALPRQRRRSLSRRLRPLLTDPRYVERRVCRSTGLPLLRDIRLASKWWPEEVPGAMRSMEALLALELQAFENSRSFITPTIVDQQIFNQAVAIGAPDIADTFGSRLKELGRPYVQLQWATGSATRSVDMISDASFYLGMLHDGRLLCPTSSEVARIWNADGHTPPVALGTDGPVGPMLTLSDGRVVSASGRMNQSPVQVWDPTGERETVILRSDAFWAKKGIMPSPPGSFADLGDGRLAAAGR